MSTPGPWTFDPEEVGGSYQIYPVDKFLDPWIGDVKGSHVGPKNNDEVLANARLIAAAPDLLAVLNAFVAETVDYMTINKLGDPEKQHNVKWARQVIARVNGDAP